MIYLLKNKNDAFIKISFMIAGVFIGFIFGNNYYNSNNIEFIDHIDQPKKYSQEFFSSTTDCDLTQITKTVKSVLEKELNSYFNNNNKIVYSEIPPKNHAQNDNKSAKIKNEKLRALVLERISKQREERKKKKIEKSYNTCQQTILDAIGSGKWTSQDSDIFRNNVYSLPEEKQSELIEKLFYSIEQNQIEHQGPPL